MTGAGAPGAAGILQCLWQEASIQVTVADASTEAVGRFLATDFEQIPFGDAPGFIDAMLALCRQRNIHVVLPLVTRELIPLASHVEDFAVAGARVLVSPAASLEIANNKSRLYEFLEWRGIVTPAYRVVETLEQFKEAVHELGYPVKPVCFKPSVSNGSRGFRIMDPGIDEHALLFNQKPGAAYISIGDAERILGSSSFPELLVSEYLPGDEFSVDCLADHGNARLIVPRLRQKIVNGISVAGMFVNDEDIINDCNHIISELQLHGNIGIQMKRSASGKCLILEINPRVQGTISAALGAGVNLPLLAIKQELGLPVMPEELQVKWGARFSRYWREVFH